ncbi:glycosyltransferase [Rhodopila sp.]|uniref:glycosyltransferase n=1 Tax=Rhodopila sp. TaxID=2480087 RepID=UPI003D0C3BD1
MATNSAKESLAVPSAYAAVVECLSSSSFWPPQHLVESAWLRHGPFAFWLTEVLQPSTFVELGTHNGFSYLAFCQAVRRLGAATSCFAIDTWKGDDHAGHYGEEVFTKLKATNNEYYSTFSHLVRSVFDEALPRFGDGTIDLLHIDGRHTYEDVRHDYETWRPKLSEQAIVLLHDTRVRERDFGVWRLWAELSGKYPSFEFDHGHGLGVLAVGHSIPAELRSLFEAVPEQRTAIRAAYSRLGAAVSTQYVLNAARNFAAAQGLEIAQLPRLGTSNDARILTEASQALEKAPDDEVTYDAVARFSQQWKLNVHAIKAIAAETEQFREQAAAASAARAAQLAEQARVHAEAVQTMVAEIERVRAEQTAAAAYQDRMKTEALKAMVAEADRLREHASAGATSVAAVIAEQARLRGPGRSSSGGDLEAVRAELALALAERDALRYSTVWRATQPLRRAGQAMPFSARQALRRLARASYWLLTMQFGHRLAEWRTNNEIMLSTSHAPEETSALEDTSPPLIASPPVCLPAADADYERWVHDHDTINEEDRDRIREHVSRLAYRPLISVVMPAYNTPADLLRQAIESVRAQIYQHWELCIADDGSSSDGVISVVREVAAADARIKWTRRERNGHIAAATNSALTLASGDFVALMDHDDLLAEHALYEIAAELNLYPDTDLIYTDEDKVDSTGRRYQPYFKPDWNIDLLLGHNMFSHLGVYRRELLTRIGGLREGVVDGSQDYDLVLRCVGASRRPHVRHVPSVLYHWRQMDRASSFSQVHLDRCTAAARQGIRDYLEAQGVKSAEVVAASAIPTWNRVCWPLPQKGPRASLIVPTRDQTELLARCVSGLLHRTSYPDLELLIVDNDSREQPTLELFERLRADNRVRILHAPGQFNYSILNNLAVHEATGDIIVLVNNDIDVIDGGWLRELVSIAVRPDVGAVGPKLLFGDGRIQHAGVVLGVGNHGTGPGVAGHFGYSANRDEIGYFGQYALTREVSAVTGACLAMRKAVYEAVGGLDPDNLPVTFNDVDLCLRIRAQGLRVIWTPFAELYHLESASRGLDRTPEQVARAAREADYMRHQWGPELDNDPFYNPNFRRLDHDFRLANPPLREKRWRQ